MTGETSSHWRSECCRAFVEELLDVAAPLTQPVDGVSLARHLRIREEDRGRASPIVPACSRTAQWHAAEPIPALLAPRHPSRAARRRAPPGQAHEPDRRRGSRSSGSAGSGVCFATGLRPAAYRPDSASRREACPGRSCPYRTFVVEVRIRGVGVAQEPLAAGLVQAASSTSSITRTTPPPPPPPPPKKPQKTNPPQTPKQNKKKNPPPTKPPPKKKKRKKKKKKKKKKTENKKKKKNQNTKKNNRPPPRGHLSASP